MPAHMKMAEAKSTKALMKHPVFGQEYDFSGKYGLDLTDDRVHDLKKIFAIANQNETGVIGRKQFQDLMDLLCMRPTEEELDKMMLEMDENGDGEIEFEEFAVALVHTYDDDMLSDAAATAIGARGTTMWERGEIIWAINTNIVILCISMQTCLLLFFDFILMPMTLAYFMVFLLLPLLNVFSKRPLNDKLSCGPPADRKPEDESIVTCCTDIFTLGKVPVGLGVILTLLVFFGTLIFLVQLVIGELTEFLDDPEIQDNLDQLKIDFDTYLNDSGLVILEPPICQFEKECPFGPYNCYGPKGIDCKPDGYTPEMLSELIGHFTGFFNQFALVMLFVVYLMTEIVPGEPLLGTIGPAAMEIELMISHYISLKTMLSFMTGVAVSIILLLVQIKLAVLFGIMSFVLNYIPNVGSMIAMFLPTPVVLLDPALESWQQVMAFVGPGAVQMYVGNVLEPTVFGSSLNLTPLSILGALVMWGSIWKLPGAVLSVPLLGIQKILCVYTNHPIAKYVLIAVREDPTLDEAKERHETSVSIPDAKTEDPPEEDDVEVAAE